MANVLIVNSSARKQANSRILAAQVAEGASGKGHSVKTLDISKWEIKPCIGCGACQENPGECVFKDEMSASYPDILGADVVIFSSPIYYFMINGQMKLFLDRTYPVLELIKNKKFGGVFSYGDVDPVKSGCINALRMFQDICNYAGHTWIGAVYGSFMEQGEAKAAPELLKQAKEFGEALA